MQHLLKQIFTKIIAKIKIQTNSQMLVSGKMSYSMYHIMCIII